MRRFFFTAAFLLFPLTAMAEPPATCDRAAFAAVVAEASAELTAMNDANKKSFQEKLARLRARESWSDADYLAKAAPLVKDERIAGFDEVNKALLADVQSLGTAPLAAGAAALLSGEARQCAMLSELRGLLGKLIDTTRAKWTYMFGKVDAAWDAPRQAKAAQ